MKHGALLYLFALLMTFGCEDPDEGPVADAAAATDSAVSDVDGGAAGWSWSSGARVFFETYCWSCHGLGDSAGRDYSALEVVAAESESIRCGVSPVTLSGCAIPAGQFPVGSGPRPTEAERQALVQWIEDGMPE